MKPKLVIFDFDGVIVNTEDIFFHKLYDTLKNFNINISFQETYKVFAGNDTYSTLKNIINKYYPSLSADEVFNYLTKSRPNWVNKVAKTPYIDELLNKLAVPFCIASNSSKEHIVDTLKVIKLDNFFTQNTIFSAYELGSFKPNPTVYLEALKNMGFSAEESIAIEDSIPGLTAARKANIPTIGFAGSVHVNFKEHSSLLQKNGAFITVNSFKDIIDILT